MDVVDKSFEWKMLQNATVNVEDIRILKYRILFY